jgi:hypothetical protein
MTGIVADNISRQIVVKTALDETLTLSKRNVYLKDNPPEHFKNTHGFERDDLVITRDNRRDVGLVIFPECRTVTYINTSNELVLE